MKKYHEMAKESAKEKLSHYGKVDEADAPMSIRARNLQIERQVQKARGGKVVGKMHGEKAAHRLDRYASGGAVKGKGKTVVNINVGPPQGAAPQPMPVPVPVGGPPPGAIPPGLGAMPPRPPMPMPPPGAMPPPGMMRKRGGRVMTAGSGSGEGRLEKIGRRAKPADKEGVASGI